MATTRTRRHHVRRMLAIGLIGVWAVWLLVAGQGELLIGLVVWSLVGIPVAAGVVALGRHSHDVGSFLGGEDPFAGDGHGGRRRR